MSDKEQSEKKSLVPENKVVRKFQVGNLAVYPAHGVGRIEAIESRVINEEKQDFYIMKILENSMVIMIPVQNVESVGLRDIIDGKEVESVYAVMKNRNISQDNQTWNRRYRDYMDKIKTGSLYEVAGVFRDLFLLKLTKELSFGERKLLDTAQSLLVKELSIAKETEEEIIMNEINSLFADSVPPANDPDDDNSDETDQKADNKESENDADADSDSETDPIKQESHKIISEKEKSEKNDSEKEESENIKSDKKSEKKDSEKEKPEKKGSEKEKSEKKDSEKKDSEKKDSEKKEKSEKEGSEKEKSEEEKI